MQRSISKIKIFLLTLLWVMTASCAAQLREPPSQFTIAQLKYGGGGDWYANPSSLPNLLRFIRSQTRMDVVANPARTALMDSDLFGYPMLYMTGHGNILLTDEETVRLRRYLDSGGFLHADDNYGMDKSFRREIKKVFPDKELVELPFSHGIFKSWFKFTGGLPKVHEHDGKRPQALGIFSEGRLVVLYTYECDLGDGWEDPNVHDNPQAIREAALRMGTNIVVWAMTH